MLARAKPINGEIVIGAQRYRALLLDSLEIAEPALVESIAAIAEAGIAVVALGRLPSRAPGLGRGAEDRDRRVRAAKERISKRVVYLGSSDRLESTLSQRVKSTLVEPDEGASLSVSLERRRSEAGETLLVFNESWSPQTAKLRFVRGGGTLTLWNPMSGNHERLLERVEPGTVMPLKLEPAETLILTLAASSAKVVSNPLPGVPKDNLDLARR